MAAERGAFIDQSQSLNLFVAAPTIGKLSSMYLHAWKQGLKTTYYLRSRPATRIAATTIPAPDASVVPMHGGPSTDVSGVACSLENPDTCEACD
jgi:ribonucleoside-diphosphate reductase alpha chain